MGTAVVIFTGVGMRINIHFTVVHVFLLAVVHTIHIAHMLHIAMVHVLFFLYCTWLVTVGHHHPMIRACHSRHRIFDTLIEP